MMARRHGGQVRHELADVADVTFVEFLALQVTALRVNVLAARPTRTATCRTRVLQPASAGATAAPAWLSGNLIQQSPRVCLHPALHRFCGVDSEDLDPRRRHRPAGGGPAHELTEVCTTIDPAYRDPVPGSKNILEGDREI